MDHAAGHQVAAGGDLATGRIQARDAVRATGQDRQAIGRDGDLVDAGELGGPRLACLRRGARPALGQERVEVEGDDLPAVGTPDQEPHGGLVVGEGGDRAVGRPAAELRALERVAGNQLSAVEGEGHRALAAGRGARRGDGQRGARRAELGGVADVVRVGGHHAGRDEVLGQHRVGPLVGVLGPPLLPVGEPLHRRPRVVDLVEVIALRHVDAPHAEQQREEDEAEDEQGVQPVEATPRFAEERVGGHARTPPARRGARRIGLVNLVGERRDRHRGRIGPGRRGHGAQAHGAPGEPGEGDDDEHREQVDADVVEQPVVDPGGRAHRLAVHAGVHHGAAGEAPVRGVDPHHVGGDREGEQAVERDPAVADQQQRPTRRGQRRQPGQHGAHGVGGLAVPAGGEGRNGVDRRREGHGAGDRDRGALQREGRCRARHQRCGEGEGREQVALVDAGGEHEERRRHQQRPDEESGGIVAPPDLPQGEQRSRGEEDRAHGLPRHHGVAEAEGDPLPRAAGDVLPRPVAAPGQRVAEAAPRAAPQVEGVDGQPLVGRRRVAELVDEALGRVLAGMPDRHPERRQQQDQRPDADRDRGQDADRVRAAVTLRVARASGEVPLEPHQGHDRDQECVLELHQQADDGAQAGGLGPAARQGVKGPHDDQRPDRVDLAPDRAVEDGDRVEEVDPGRHQPQRLAAPYPPAEPEAPVEEAAAVGEQEVRHADVGQDAGDLHQAGGGVLADQRGQGVANDTQQPQDVQVAGRIVGEVAGLVEFARPETCQPLAPGGEVADVDPESALRQQDAGDQDPQQQTEDEDGSQQRAGVEGQAAEGWPRAPPPYGTGGQRKRRPCGRRWK